MGLSAYVLPRAYVSQWTTAEEFAFMEVFPKINRLASRTERSRHLVHVRLINSSVQVCRFVGYESDEDIIPNIARLRWRRVRVGRSCVHHDAGTNIRLVRLLGLPNCYSHEIYPSFHPVSAQDGITPSRMHPALKQFIQHKCSLSSRYI